MDKENQLIWEAYMYHRYDTPTDVWIGDIITIIDGKYVGQTAEIVEYTPDNIQPDDDASWYNPYPPYTVRLSSGLLVYLKRDQFEL